MLNAMSNISHLQKDSRDYSPWFVVGAEVDIAFDILGLPFSLEGFNTAPFNI